MFAESTTLFFSVLPALLPQLGISGIGLFYAVSEQAKAPRAFRYAKWGFVLLLVQALGGTWLQAIMLRWRMMPPAQGMPEAMVWPGIVSAGSQLLFFAGLFLVARAVFLDRAK